jgi:hypothetical protein
MSIVPALVWIGVVTEVLNAPVVAPESAPVMARVVMPLRPALNRPEVAVSPAMLTVLLNAPVVAPVSAPVIPSVVQVRPALNAPATAEIPPVVVTENVPLDPPTTLSALLPANPLMVAVTPALAAGNVQFPVAFL